MHVFSYFKMATSKSFLRIREYLKNRLLSHQNNECDYISQSAQNSVSTLMQLLERSIVCGEGNSLLLTGPRGVGKSWAVQQALKKLQSDSKINNNFIYVSLNGLVHTDDRYALLEIAKQLDVETLLGDKPSLSFSAALNYMLDGLRSGDNKKQCVLFILDEFDLFTNHKNQTLLYNLFDLSQTPFNPVLVIGVTCRLDVMELLEKRVKSRFSHRQLHIYPDYQFEEYVSLFRTLLQVPSHVCSDYKRWNKHIQNISQDENVKILLKASFNHSADVRSLKSLLTYPICRLNENGLTYDMLKAGLSVCHYVGDSKLPLLHGLSVLELSLLVASKHISELYKDEPINFEMIFEEYSKFTSHCTHNIEHYNKPVIMKAFEKLVSIEFLCPISESLSSNMMKEYQPMRLMVDGSQIITGVKSYSSCPTDLYYWVTREPIT